jgi:hypothetical protein
MALPLWGSGGIASCSDAVSHSPSFIRRASRQFATWGWFLSYSRQLSKFDCYPQIFAFPACNKENHVTVPRSIQKNSLKSRISRRDVLRGMTLYLARGELTVEDL